MIVVLIFLSSLIQITNSKLIVQNDEFHGYLNGIYHKFTDETGASWELPAHQNKLELLINDFNDKFVSFETCKETFYAANSTSATSTKNLTFVEVAQTVGFNHVHREVPAQRPACQFDTVINGAYNFSARFEGESCLVEHMTGGAAAGDYDNDGYVDIFFTVYYGPSLLYRNNGDGTFTEVSKECKVGPSMYANGAGWVDVDSDGDLDLFVTTAGDIRHYLYINQGGHFTEEAVEREISLKFPSQRKLAGFTPAFGDFDQDGYVDIYTTEWIVNSQAGTKVSASKLFRNKGSSNPGHFEDVTNSSGVTMEGLWSSLRNTHNDGTHTYGASFTDFDDDGWPELFVVGDYGKSRMFWNNKDGTFDECTTQCGINDQENAMGYTVGDVNNDGMLDLFVTGVYYDNQTCELYSCKLVDNHNGNGLYQNHGSRNFTDSTLMYDVENFQWAWGTSFIDFNNDGKLDIVATNGYPQKSFVKDDMNLLRNEGRGKKMVDVAMDVGMKYDGMGRGLLVFDYDNDGDEDVVVVGNVGLPKLFRNDGGNSKNWIKIRPMQSCEKNTEKACDSLGATVTVTSQASGLSQTAQVGSKSHYLGQSEVIVHFGIGDDKEVDVKVSWPRFKKDIYIQNVRANQMLKIFPSQGSGNSNTAFLSSTDIPKCQHLLIKEITQQPSDGKILINSDRRSVRYDTGDYTIVDVGLQHFKYKAEVVPGSLEEITKEGTVTLDFRGQPNLFIPKCKNEMNISQTDERRFDGLSNNKQHMIWGAVKEDLLSIAPHAYADNISEPASACTRHHKLTKSCPYPHEFSGVGSTRPSAREISNKLMTQTKNIFSKRNMSDLTMHFGQFISHDVDHSTPLPRQDFMQYHQNQVWMPITIPKGDVHFDPYNTGKEQMPFIRTTFSGCSGNYMTGKQARKQFNTITAFIDGNTVYGVDEKRANYLREFKNGRLRMRSNLMLPKNEAYMKNANPVGRPGHELYIAGDVRVNVQPGLAAFHTLFVREHNRLAHEYVLSNPIASDEEAFQHARRMLIAELQAITYKEFLPALLGGDHHIPKYTGYKKDVKSGVTNEFATAVFRYGHSQVNSLVYRLQKNGEPIKQGHAILREVYFKPNRLELEGGLDPIFRGALAFPTQEIDMLMVDEMRNSLFKQNDASPGKPTGFDLAAFNIQRGRDHGLADFNTVRKQLGLKVYKTFDEVTSDRMVARDLEELYKDINNIDLWVGGLAEDHVHNSELGETFHTIMVEQLTRIRDGDRFWYQSLLSEKEIELVEKTTLAEIIRMNTGFDECPDHVFFSSNECSGMRNFQCVPRDGGMNFQTEYHRMKEEKENEIKKTELLTIITAVLGVIALICVLLVLRAILAAKRDSADVKEPKEMYTNTMSRGSKVTFEMGVPNEGVEA